MTEQTQGKRAHVRAVHRAFWKLGNRIFCVRSVPVSSVPLSVRRKAQQTRGKDTRDTRDTKNSIWHKKRESIMLPGKQGTCAALPANETIAALAEKYPRCFALLETKRRPLANRIHDALLATVAPDERGTILFALRIYTSNMRYLARCVENAPRIDLSGKIAGRVTARTGELRHHHPKRSAPLRHHCARSTERSRSRA